MHTLCKLFYSKKHPTGQKEIKEMHLQYTYSDTLVHIQRKLPVLLSAKQLQLNVKALTCVTFTLFQS
jgi:hypothetical protein